jgi:hypothetical protein
VAQAHRLRGFASDADERRVPKAARVVMDDDAEAVTRHFAQ